MINVRGLHVYSDKGCDKGKSCSLCMQVFLKISLSEASRQTTIYAVV